MLTFAFAACMGLRSGPLIARAESGSTSKGMGLVALVELGSGCAHGISPTKAAVRACNDAVEWNSIKVGTIIPGSYDNMKVHVHIAVPHSSEVDVQAIRDCFPYGKLLPVSVVDGGLLGSSRAGLPEDEPPEAMMTVANACVTVGFDPLPLAASGSTPSAAAASPTPPPPSPALDASARAPGLLGRPTEAELTPGSPELLARADASASRWGSRVLTPYEAFAFLADEDDVEIYDVRTEEQRASHSINGRGAKTVLGSISRPIDDIVSGAAEPPPANQPVLLVCSKGPKSLVALDFLSAVCPKAVCVAGGIAAWDAAALPTEDVLPELN
jgi:uncharacterized protein (TIGR02058 family)